MRPLVILVEEPSMKIVAEELCRRFCEARSVHVIPHEGKSDLRLSFPRKLRAWITDADFLILHDKDSSPDCVKLKRELLDLVPAHKRAVTKVRIVMNELEAWYLSDLEALVSAGLINAGTLTSLHRKRKFRDVERLNNAKQEFSKLVRERGQRKLARLIAPHLDPQRSQSISFRLFCRDISTLSRV